MITPALCAGEAPIASLPTTKWSVVSQTGDTVQLSEEGGALSIKYAVTIDSDHQVGHRNFKQRSFYVKLNEAIPVRPGDARVMFEIFGQHMTTHSGSSQDQAGLRPVIEDANGELLSYTPRPYPHLKSGSINWGMWYSPTFYTSEAGGATQDVYEAEGGDRNAWPDGALKFWGFRVDVRLPQYGKASGKLMVGDLRFGPEQFGYEDPCLYMDSILKEAGEYRIAATVRNRFQGKALSEVEHTIKYDPADQNTRRQKIAFKLGPDDFYWIDYQVRNAAGKVVASDSLRHHVWGRVDNPPKMTPIDPKTAPVAGNLRIAPNADWKISDGVGGVFARQEPLRLNVRVFPKGKTNVTLDWDLRQVLYPASLASGSVAVATSSSTYEDVELNLPAEAGRDAYKLKITLKSNGSEIDNTDYFLGKQTDFSVPYGNRVGRIQDRNMVKESTYPRTTYLEPPTLKIKSEDEAIELFKKVADDAMRVAPFMTYMIDLRDFEVLPGVYDLALLDRIMDAAADRACALTIRLAHMDSQGAYRWQPFYGQYGQDGLEIEQHPYGAYALTDHNVTDAWHRAYRAMFDRYQKHPGFQGYYMMKPGGEWTVVDEPWTGLVSGYEPPTRAAFEEYMQRELKSDLSALNKRWKTNYKKWDELGVPRPIFETGTLPDLRMQWLDFCRFKDWLGHEGWFPPAAKKIREYDPNHVIITYGIVDPKIHQGQIDYYHNGGNHFLKLEGKLIDDWKTYHTGWITEPIHPHRWANNGDPAERGWVLDWSTWIMTAQAGAGGANLHVYNVLPPMELLAKYGGAYSYDRFEKFTPILRELQKMTLIDEPRRIGTLYDPYTLFTKHRTTFSARIEDMIRWFELLKYDSVSFESIEKDRIDQYKLLLPNALDQVMSESNIRMLGKAVRVGGAKMIMTAITGQYCPELADEKFPLLRELGIEAPTGQYVRNNANVTAEVITENPFFDKGNQLKFFSQLDQQAALQSDLVKTTEKFWQWPFRWIPQTDYFGYFPGQSPKDAVVIARFADGGAAVTKHIVGKGEVVIFWGMPNYTRENYSGMMAKAESWAGITNPRRGNPITFMLEGKNESLNRFYVLLYHEKPGTYKQAFPHAPDGEYFIDDMVIDQRLGTYRGEELRRGELPITWYEGMSPLKIFRLIPKNKMQANWLNKYRVPNEK